MTARSACPEAPWGSETLWNSEDSESTNTCAVHELRAPAVVLPRAPLHEPRSAGSGGLNRTPQGGHPGPAGCSQGFGKTGIFILGAQEGGGPGLQCHGGQGWVRSWPGRAEWGRSREHLRFSMVTVPPVPIQLNVRRSTVSGGGLRMAGSVRVASPRGLSAGDRRGTVRGEVMAEELHEPKTPCWRTQACKGDDRRARTCDASIEGDT